MRDHSNHIEVTRDEAASLVLGSVEFHPATEEVTLDKAYGRVLAEDAIARIDSPTVLTCNRDSVALHWDDFKDGQVPDTSSWTRGVEWQFANTGVAMPEGFDTAIAIEGAEVSEDNEHLTLQVLPKEKFEGTTPAGANFHAGDVLAEAGSVLSPLLVSRVAAGNNAAAKVLQKPLVAFIPTGNELVKPGSTDTLRHNIETNSLLAAGKLAEWGADCKVWDIVPDSPELIKQAVLDAVESCDIVVLNAGSSKGSDDWNIEMLEEVGMVLYHQTNHGPGHHSSAAVVNGKPVIGISGPAGGVAFTMDFYVYPVVMKYLGQPTELTKLQVRLSEPFPAMPGQSAKPASAPKGEAAKPASAAHPKGFYRVKQLHFTQEEGSAELWAEPAKGSAFTPTVADVQDCYYLQESNAPELKFGDIIEVDVRP